MSWLDGLNTDADVSNQESNLPPVGAGGPTPGLFKNSLSAIDTGLQKGVAKVGDTLGFGVGQVRDNPLTVPTLDQFKQSKIDARINFADQLKSLTPTPEDSGTAAIYLNQFADVIPRTVAGSVFAGPAGAFVAAGAPEYGASTAESQSQGIDADTASQKGVIDAGVTGVGAILPGSFAKNIIKDAVITIGGNVGLGVAERGGNEALLRANGYDTQADQYKAFDGKSMAIDGLMGLAFMGATRFGAAVGERNVKVPPETVDAALVGNLAKHDSASGPGATIDPQSVNIHKQTLEDTLTQLVNDEPVSIKTDIGKAGFMRESRGIRNNNPGNIRADGTPWQGMTGSDGTFAAFDSPESGVRALSKNLLSYQDKHGLNTVETLISRWAPPGENNTGAYVDAVSKQLGVTPDQPLNLRNKDTLASLTSAIIKHENGSQPYSADIIDHGVSKALGSIPVDGAEAAVRAQLADRKDVPDALKVAIANKYRDTAALKPEFDQHINDITQEVGTPHTPLLPDALKGVDRATEKIMFDYGGDPNGIKDLNRATIVVDNIDQAQAALKSTIGRFGDPVGEVRNALLPDSPPVSAEGYRDIKVNVMQGDGHVAEVQINFPQMLDAKERAHPLYEDARSINADLLRENRKATPDEAVKLRELRDKQKAIYDAAWADATSPRNLTSETNVPLWSNDALENLRGSDLSQARQSKSGVQETGTPSTSANSVSLGNDAGKSNNLFTSIVDSITNLISKSEPPKSGAPKEGTHSSPEIASALESANKHPDMRVTLDDGSEVSAHEALSMINDDVNQATADSKAYEAAVLCFMRNPE